MKGRIQGKVALITGAAQGIGLACAKLFIQEGGYVILSDIQDELGISIAKKLGAQAEYMHLDVQLESDWEKAIKHIVKAKGKLDILVNNAGITGFQKGFGPQDPENASLESWRKINAVNSDGTFLGCKYAIKAMKSGKGSIVNISSRSGLVGIPGAAAYAASKAAVRNHTKSVALYCCQKGYPIRCNSVHPAAILTPMWEEMLGPPDHRKEQIAHLVKDIPMQKFGDTEDVAFAVLFLASEESKYMTGSELTIDGGILAGSSASPKKD